MAGYSHIADQAYARSSSPQTINQDAELVQTLGDVKVDLGFHRARHDRRAARLGPLLLQLHNPRLNTVVNPL